MISMKKKIYDLNNIIESTLTMIETSATPKELLRLSKMIFKMEKQLQAHVYGYERRIATFWPDPGDTTPLLICMYYCPFLSIFLLLNVYLFFTSFKRLVHDRYSADQSC